MPRTSVFTHKSFRSFLLVLAVLFVLFLSGCQASTEPIDAETTGTFNHYVVYPFSFLIKYFASLFNGNYGLSIVLMTLLIRIAIMPLMLKQFKMQMFMKEKMTVIKPEMDELREKYKNDKTSDAKRQMQKEMMELYQKHNFNPMASMGGCLPMFIQLPIMIGFYYAIMRTPEIAEHTFLWFNLGESDIVLPFIAAFVYLVQFKISQQNMDIGNEQQKQQMAVMGYMMPLFMGFISFNVAAALPLYWSVGGLFLIGQTLLFRWIVKPKTSSIETSMQKQ
ncbi:membrane protein insertase YidC [Texcoconibacillus texcoconensis]|uniref:Membrane protein insertase YidC n=1 Tax=Texcoconibacillus texcoconensis TaxID=1095777 RepID=A0A840QSC5_9BACI|nr:membrane protein insertase YidC [Texcoconibacillus texcoconensis]MBB5174177.1 YidC/Oxa1 family membrane protein insertase [Texcoconibacillus texcoconensis]